MSEAMLSPPPGTDLNDNAQSLIRGGVVSTWILAIIAVVLRFTSRRMARAGFWVDDWLMLPALTICTLLTSVAGVWQIDHGFGKHIYVLPNPPQSALVMLQALFIAELCYTGAVLSVKFSILALYWRIFKLNMKLPIYVVATMVLCWAIAVFLLTVLQCHPLKGFWNKSVKAECGVNDYLFFYGNSIPNIITDFALLGLPIPCISKLKVPLSQKVSLSGTFILGGLYVRPGLGVTFAYLNSVVAIGIVRLTVLLKINAVLPDITWSLWPSQLWTSVELNVAVVSGCLPSLRPILAFILTGFSRLHSSRSASSPTSDNDHHDRYMWRAKISNRTDYPTTEVSNGDDVHPFARLSEDKNKPQGRGQDLELETFNTSEGGIQVRDEFRVE